MITFLNLSTSLARRESFWIISSWFAFRSAFSRRSRMFSSRIFRFSLLSMLMDA